MAPPVTQQSAAGRRSLVLAGQQAPQTKNKNQPLPGAPAQQTTFQQQQQQAQQPAAQPRTQVPTGQAGYQNQNQAPAGTSRVPPPAPAPAQQPATAQAPAQQPAQAGVVNRPFAMSEEQYQAAKLRAAAGPQQTGTASPYQSGLGGRKDMGRLAGSESHQTQQPTETYAEATARPADMNTALYRSSAQTASPTRTYGQATGATAAAIPPPPAPPTPSELFGRIRSDLSPTGDFDGDGKNNTHDNDPRVSDQKVEDPLAGHGVEDPHAPGAEGGGGPGTDSFAQWMAKLFGVGVDQVGLFAQQMTESDMARARANYDGYLKEMQGMRDKANEMYGSTTRKKAEEAARLELTDSTRAEQERQMRQMMSAQSRGGAVSSGGANSIYSAAQGNLQSGLRGITQDAFEREQTAANAYRDAMSEVADRDKEFTDQNFTSTKEFMSWLMEMFPDEVTGINLVPGGG